MALSDNLNGKTVQELINDDTFITALVPKIAAGAGTLGVYTKEAAGTTFAKIDGSNATDPGVTAMLGKLTDKVVKTSELSAKAAEKPVVDAITASANFINKVYIKADPADEVYTKTAADAGFVKIDGSNATDPGVTAMLGKLTDKVVKTSELSAKAAEKPVVDAITASANFINKVYIKADPADEVYTKTAADAGFVKTDGSNATDAGVTAMLGKLTDKVVKTSELSAKAADKAVVEAIFNAQDLTDPANPINVAETKIGATFAKKTDLDNKADANGTNLDDAKVTAILEKLTDKVVKTSELSAKAADKAVVEAILDAKDDQKSILVEKLGGFLDAPETLYGAQGNQAAKAFLAEKGLNPTPTDVANELITNNIQALQTAVAADAGLKAVLAKPADIAAIPALQEAVAKNPDLQKAVAQNEDLHNSIMSQPSFEIPTDLSSPLSWDW